MSSFRNTFVFFFSVFIIGVFLLFSVRYNPELSVRSTEVGSKLKLIGDRNSSELLLRLQEIKSLLETRLDVVANTVLSRLDDFEERLDSQIGSRLGNLEKKLDNDLLKRKRMSTNEKPKPESIERTSSSSTNSTYDIHFQKIIAAQLKARKPRVAFCMSGAIRAGASPFVYENIKTNIDHAVGNGTAYLIMVVKNERDERLLKYSRKRLTEDDLKPAVDHLKPLYWRILPDTSDELNPRDLINKACGRSNKYGMAEQIWPQLFGWKQCYEEVERQEFELGFKFDWVVRIRPDVVYLSPIYAIQSLDPNLVTFSGIFNNGSAVSDKIWYAPRRYAEAVFSTVDRYFHIPKHEWKDTKALTEACKESHLNPEMALASRMKSKKIPYGATNEKILTVIVRVRSDGVCFPDCMRISRRRICDEFAAKAEPYCNSTDLYRPK
uniref:Uncharacterized protein n=1 Tax=Aplanochytrium stocchinoi TaxID=215587 RepID=A0A7S3V0V8_9STRA|mmetsp:Transcript_33826/g.41698  ORF Transcript_33826/g.41698 Transcript_33826/m.41698 type:complete len:437 (-) Transcript_33826:127-1437(-)|eukprot:CAMPEP_0204830232 /NCGR_PEP_ID=MMETSP1346-20131115/8412_1 /ASSEMBLY_ACC=CAM_ASM_000771 /TAXON_ID=215587 /ORGANISM="Aplanochytrium stocchinoi, Strain GSBS06" /LENGTH=436 /DNA_ID=CAMNT_0051960391 /DNA_START=133 /DNA_END=1443 /DNA_ORIENTATION=+